MLNMAHDMNALSPCQLAVSFEAIYQNIREFLEGEEQDLIDILLPDSIPGYEHLIPDGGDLDPWPDFDPWLHILGYGAVPILLWYVFSNLQLPLR